MLWLIWEEIKMNFAHGRIALFASSQLAARTYPEYIARVALGHCNMDWNFKILGSINQYAENEHKSVSVYKMYHGNRESLHAVITRYEDLDTWRPPIHLITLQSKDQK